ncbi:MAG: DUF1573 domain-containing protein [Desulfosalsimonas sp.]
MTSLTGSLITRVMKNNCFCLKKICLLLVLAACIQGLVPSAANCAPRAVAEKQRHDFGTAYAGSKVFYTFNIENTGDEELVIKSVRTG